MSVGERMQFIKFEQKNDEWKIVKSWLKQKYHRCLKIINKFCHINLLKV